jgi:ribonucleoside-diphosphate reductase alpha chain
MHEQLQTEIAHHVWQSRYRRTTGAGAAEADIEATWRRVAAACAAVEGADAARWQTAYLQALDDFRFLPAGRILVGAGSGAQVTLCNCFVMGLIEDSLQGICRALEESALTMQQGGGIGLDFSTLRPRGTRAREVARIASGPVSFMQVWAAMCDTLTSTTGRGGAMMATLRCDHPDILEFVEAKRVKGMLGSFNLSVQVTDAFMAAVRKDETWPLMFPAERVNGDGDGDGEIIERRWPGSEGPVPCRVLGRLSARSLWETIMRSAYETAEPGVIFIDTVNGENNLAYREQISATNPCGELPLPSYGACDLGSINLAPFVVAPFAEDAAFDLDGIRSITRTAVRFLDAVIDVSHYPLPEQRRTAQGSRRIGLGITGLADALMLLGLHYDSEAARSQAATVMQVIRNAAYETSIELAREKGAFPYFERELYLSSPFVQRLPAEIRDDIARDGIRNSHLLAIAPTGSISLLANNVSTGIEPAFDLAYQQRIRIAENEVLTFQVENHALRLWRDASDAAPPPAWFVTARALPPGAHLAMQAALQPFVDSAISKTINLPEVFPFESMQDVYSEAYELGLKGCTVYRPHDGESAAPLSSAGIECGRCQVPG